ncbi:MAG: flagellar protein FliS [Thermogutta sp.]|nr:flagellar protein FliS [Thermogutta sp.]
MQPSYGDRYLESEVLTASPQRLHLLLIEAAIRYIERTRAAWQRQDGEAAFETLTKAQQIVAEMLAGMKKDAAPDLVRQVAAIYTFVYRTLVEAGLKQDETLLGDALRVLHIEQETWLEVCRKSGPASGEDEASLAAAASPAEVSTSNPASPAEVSASTPAAPAPPRYLTTAAPNDYSVEDAAGHSWEA